MPTRNGSIRLFRLFGIDVYLHWSWFAIAVFELQDRTHHYHSYVWNALEYVGLFVIVLLHEFGHALACRQVGGRANMIVLWPLGGVAYVSPPQRPGAVLWSIAAGPLVNVALLPVFLTFWYCSQLLGWPNTFPDLYHFLSALLWIDIGLLVFNMLPFYPLDGGQILRSLLWFPFGRANSLTVATIIGFIGVACMGLFAVLMMTVDVGAGVWPGILTLFMGFNCWRGLRQAMALSKLEKSPRRTEFACPVCRTSPPLGEFWKCSRCRQPFDTFLTKGFCPHCNAEYAAMACPFCFALRPLPEWQNYQAWATPPVVQ